MTMINKYVKKPVEVEALQFTGDNVEEIETFTDKKAYPRFNIDKSSNLYIDTLEGIMTVNVGDYVIKGVCGEFYPCKPDIFEKTYSLVNE